MPRKTNRQKDLEEKLEALASILESTDHEFLSLIESVVRGDELDVCMDKIMEIKETVNISKNICYTALHIES